MKVSTMLIAFVLLAPGGDLHAQSRDIVATESIVEAPVDEVWRAFTTKDGIESWMVAKTDFELRVGATWRTSYSKDSNLDDDGAIHATILAYDPGRMLSFRTVKPPKDFAFPAAIMRTWTVVYFEPVDAAKTKVTIRMLGFTGDEESQKMRPFFERGNKFTLDALTKKFKGTARQDGR